MCVAVPPHCGVNVVSQWIHRGFSAVRFCSHTRPTLGPAMVHGPASDQVLSPRSLLAGVTVLALSHFPAGAKLCRGVEGVTMCDM